MPIVLPHPASNLNAQPTVHLTEQQLNVKEVYEKGFHDIQFFANLALPDVMLFSFPPLYIAIWLMLIKAHSAEDRAKVIRFALGLPRGFAKTTFIKILICWLIVYDKITFCLVVCATEPLAENFLADVDDILSSPNMQKIYGNWSANKAIDNQKMKKCSYRRRLVILAAIGSGTSIRGLNIGHERPDFVICDDMQTKENAESDAESMRLLTWFTGTLLKAVSPFFAMVVYIGNMYPQNCILYKLKENPYWTSLITGCILEDGRSLWEELHPIKALYESFKHDESLGLAHIWFAEMMNDPVIGQISLLPEGTIPHADKKPEDIVPEAGFIVIDPAGFKKASDDNVIGAFLVQQQKPYLVSLEAGQFNPLEVITKTITIALTLNIRVIFIESVAYQSTLKFWFEEYLKKAKLENHFILVDITPKNKAKDARIRVSVQQLLAKTWAIASLEARQRYIFQALSYKIGKNNNKDDILDTGAYVEEVRSSENWSIVYSVQLNSPNNLQAKAVGNNTPF